MIALNPVATPGDLPLLAMGGDCGDGNPQVVHVEPPSGPYDCWEIVPLGCAETTSERLLRNYGTKTFSPPVPAGDGTAIVSASMRSTLKSIEVLNDAGCAAAMVGLSLDVEAVWIDPTTGASGVSDISFLKVVSADGKWPNSPTGMPSANQWLACACLEIEGSGLSDGVKYQVKADIQQCLADHLTCLQNARNAYLTGISTCETDGNALQGLGIGAGIGAAIGSAILICITAPVSVPVAIGAVAIGAVVGGGIGTVGGWMEDEGDEAECLANHRAIYLSRLKACDGAAKNCLHGKFNAAGFSPNCPPLWPGSGNYPPIWAPPGFEHDLPPTTCPPAGDPDVQWPGFSNPSKHSGPQP